MQLVAVAVDWMEQGCSLVAFHCYTKREGSTATTAGCFRVILAPIPRIDRLDLG
jgi:hypothetical protein